MDDTIILSDASAARAAIDAFLDGTRPLSGLELYYELERVSPLIEYHTMLRDGARNVSRDGLQQSYGDHNRLLMLGLDRLVAGDVEWYGDRLDPGSPPEPDTLETCVTTAASLDVARDALVALWLAAALHDCGMVFHRGPHVDVEDGIVMCRGIFDELCPSEYRELAEFALRHHDYIKDVFLGEMPVGPTADALEALPSWQRATAAAALGYIQVAGAASLGVGRLTDFRVKIFEACVHGSPLADDRTRTRLARLCTATPERTPVRDDVAVQPGAEVDELLERVGIHGWHRTVASLDDDARLAVLDALATANREWKADHVVLRDASASARESARVETALSGQRIAVVG
jgi:hypothetical protein